MNDDPFEQNMKRLVNRHQRVAMSPELRAELLRMVARAPEQRRSVFRRAWPFWFSAAAAGILVAVILSIPREDVHREGGQPAVQEGQAPEKKQPEYPSGSLCSKCESSAREVCLDERFKCKSCGTVFPATCKIQHEVGARAEPRNYCQKCATTQGICLLCGAKMGEKPAEPAAGKELKFEVLYFDRIRAKKSVDSPKNIGKEEEWETFMKSIDTQTVVGLSGQRKPIKKPDFANEMAIVWFALGPGLGGENEITKILETSQSLEVQYRVLGKRSDINDETPTCLFYLIKLPKSDKPVKFVEVKEDDDKEAMRKEDVQKQVLDLLPKMVDADPIVRKKASEEFKKIIEKLDESARADIEKEVESYLRDKYGVLFVIAKGKDGKILEEEYHRIMTQKDWESLWKRHKGEDAKGEPPRVNFEKEMVVAIFRKIEESSNAQMQESEQEMCILITEYSDFVGPDGYLIVKVPRSAKKLKILHQRQGGMKPRPPQVIREFPELSQ